MDLRKNMNNVLKWLLRETEDRLWEDDFGIP